VGMVRPISCNVDFKLPVQCPSRMMLPGLGIEESIPVTGDATVHIVLWAQPPWPMDYESGGAHHGTFHLLPVLQMRNCHSAQGLYSFWLFIKTRQLKFSVDPPTEVRQAAAQAAGPKWQVQSSL
jgi:hypothetical protein